MEMDCAVSEQAQLGLSPSTRLTAELAHDIANLLIPVTTNCTLLLPRFLKPGLGRRCLDGIERSADQATLLARRLLALGLHRLAHPEEQPDLSSGTRYRNMSGDWLVNSLEDLLSVIDSYCRVLVKSLPERDTRLADVLEMTKASQRAHTLSCLLPGAGRGEVAETESLDLNALIADLEGVMRRLLGENTETITELAPDLADIRGDAAQIGRVLLNLATNARDAMQGKGRLTIRTWTRECPMGVGQQRRRVVLSISDTGCGMGDKVLSRAFIPGFTTKEAGQGSGLGLSIVREIVRQSNGRIHVQSIPGQGTTFEVSWPACPKQN